MKIWTFSIMWNEAKMAPWFVRHYAQFVDRMVVFCEPSTDGTENILRGCPKVDLRVWPYRGLDDIRFLAAVNSCYKEARGQADWVAFVDCDELLYHPDLRHELEKIEGDVVPSTGFALLSRDGWPDQSDPRQLYEIITTGVRQANYDKRLLFRPELDLVHDYGRHTYPGAWPKHNGKECVDIGMKLLHCHHVGGVVDTAARNRRNLGRARDKRFGWNYQPKHNYDPNQVGSVAWVQRNLEQNQLIQVVP